MELVLIAPDLSDILCSPVERIIRVTCDLHISLSTVWNSWKLEDLEVFTYWKV